MYSVHVCTEYVGARRRDGYRRVVVEEQLQTQRTTHSRLAATCREEEETESQNDV